MWPIDHARAFRLHRTIREPKNLEHCDLQLLQSLRVLDPKTAEGRLTPYLSKKETGAMFARRDQIVKIFDEKIVPPRIQSRFAYALTSLATSTAI